MRIAIFGGSFDPVHIGHKAIVKTALSELNIDKLIVVPTYLNPFKKSFYLKPQTRLKLLKKVFNNFEKVDICDYEVNKEKLSYSFDTVSYLKKLYSTNKIYFILGEDNLKNLDKWYKIEELKTLVEFVVVTRNGFKSERTEKFKILDIDINISSSLLRENMNLDYIPIEIKNDILNIRKGKSF